jgi:hypothetical protein
MQELIIGRIGDEPDLRPQPALEGDEKGIFEMNNLKQMCLYFN